MGNNYLDCISSHELDRLKSQHEAWLPETHSFLKDAGFLDAKKIMEFGSGPGLTTLDLATSLVPTAEITSVDISDYYLNHLRNQITQQKIPNIQVVRQNLTEQMQPVGSFDAAFCRWFLAWVANAIDAVLQNVHRNLRVGGTLAVMEYLTLRSTVHSPIDPNLSRYLQAWEEFYRQTGGTTEVGAMLPEKITSAGFEITDIRCVGGFSPKGDRVFQWWKRVYEDFSGKLQEKGLLSDREIQEMNSYWGNISANPNAFIYPPVLIQITAVKSSKS